MEIYSSNNITRFVATVLLILHITVTTSLGEGALSRDLVRFAKNHSSTQKPRYCQIYSRSTKKHIQIMNRKVLACGAEGDDFSKVEKTSHTFGVVTIRGVKSGKFLCMSKRGKMITKKRLSKDNSCKFVENITSAYYTTFRSEKDHNWYIGFNSKNGRAKKGKRTSPHQEACNFLIRNCKDEEEHSNELPSYIQGFAQDIRRRMSSNGQSLTRKRRHRFQTEDPENIYDEIMEKLASLIGELPPSGSDGDREEWILRAENILIDNVSSNTTLSAADLLELINGEESPATPDPALPKSRRHKHHPKSKKPCRPRKRTKCPKLENAEDPTKIPLREKRKSAMVPKTPTGVVNEKSEPNSPTLAPQISKLSKSDKAVASPKINLGKTDNHAQAREEPLKEASTTLLPKDFNLNKNNTDILHKDNLSRTLPPSPAPKVAATNSRRSKTKSKRGRNKHRNSKRAKGSS